MSKQNFTHEEKVEKLLSTIAITQAMILNLATINSLERDKEVIAASFGMVQESLAIVRMVVDSE